MAEEIDKKVFFIDKEGRKQFKLWDFDKDIEVKAYLNPLNYQQACRGVKMLADKQNEIMKELNKLIEQKNDS